MSNTGHFRTKHNVTIPQRFSVDLSYPVLFTHNIFALSNPLLYHAFQTSEQQTKRLFCIIDSEVDKLHPTLKSDLVTYVTSMEGMSQLVDQPWIIPGGEQVKNTDEWVRKIQKAVHDFGIDRHSTIMAIGGGALLDAVGYAAATSHRGIRLIRVPTTVLAQCDAALGVKNGINAFGKKNFLGTFTPPEAVFCDYTLLTTLDDRDWRGGVSECVKVALLKDPDFFDYLETNATQLRERSMEAMEPVVYRGAELHLEHIATSGDPFELGSSRPLDFGHWSAHKVEQLSNFEIRHGEAVGMGIALDATYSYQMGWLDEGDWNRVIGLFENLGLPIFTPYFTANLEYREHSDCLFKGLDEFREHLGGQLTIMMLKGIGQGEEIHEIDESVMKKSIAVLERRSQDVARV